jgi:hypothetical protein
MSKYKYSQSVVDNLLRKSRVAPREVKTDLVTRVLLIGPEEAEALLRANTSNRPIQPARVKYYTDLIKADEFRLTHQGIAFSSSGRGLDLQHRLLAIIASQKTVPLLVTEGMNDEDFFAIDQHAKRSMADSIEKPKKLVEEAKFLADFCWGAESSTQQLSSTILSMVELIEKTSQRITLACLKGSVSRMNATLRSAAVVSLMLKPESAEHVITSYCWWAKTRTEQYSISMHALARTLQTSKKSNSSAKRAEDFMRYLIIFNPDTSHIQRPNLTPAAITAMKKQCASILPKPEEAVTRSRYTLLAKPR